MMNERQRMVPSPDNNTSCKETYFNSMVNMLLGSSMHRRDEFRYHHLIIVLLAVSTIVPSLVVTPTAEGAGGSFGGGDGSPGNPYVIEDVWDLQNMSSNLSAHYILGNDIDASATASWNSGEGFAPIGARLNRFNGSLDGRNHTITGLHIDRNNPLCIGLIGCMDGGASVRDVGLTDADVTGGRYVGALVGYIYIGTVTNSYAIGNVSGELGIGGLVGLLDGGVIYTSFARGDMYASSSNVGGLVGMIYSGSVYDSNFTGNVSCRFFSGHNTGGLVGFNDGRVSGCDVRANVTGRDSVGGLVGSNVGLVRASHATGNVTGLDQVGGLVGYDSDRVYDSYFTGSVTGNESVGGIIGSCHGHGSNSHYNIDRVPINGGHHVTRGGLFDAQYSDWYSSNLSLNISDYSTSLVASGGYYNISSVQGLKDLLGFAEFSGYRFRLSADIDLSSAPGLYIPYLASEFDGENHTISNLKVNYSINNKIGFFGESKDTTIKNIGLERCYVKGGSQVGGLVGYNDGSTISNANVDGYINGTGVSGGLVGWSEGPVSGSHATGNVSGGPYVGGLLGLSDSTVYNSSASAEVNGSVYCIGGLVGRLAGGIVSYCFATGNVTSNRNDVGGLVGSNNGGTVSDSYATGNVWGRTSNVGGLVGENRGTVRNSYSTGSVVARLSQEGGLIGWNQYGTVSDSFWDVNTSGLSSSAGGVGKTTEEMMNKTTFTDAGWNFTDVWFIIENVTYPVLRWQDAGPPTADAGPDQRVSLDSNGTARVVLDGTGSTDDFGIFNYTWSFTYNGSMQLLYGEIVEFTFGIPGRYNVTLKVTDALGNQNNDTMAVTVEDNDPPTFGLDMTPSTATTGDGLLFQIPVRDNVNVSQVALIYYFEDEGVTHVEWMMRVPPGTTDMWMRGKTIPIDSLAPLHYQFSAVDSSLNGNMTNWSVITILDDDPPVLFGDLTDPNATTASDHVLGVRVTDNINITRVWVEYWFED